MKITYFKHEKVHSDGTIKNRPGKIKTNGGIVMSHENGGCGVNGCNCSDGLWISFIKPINKDKAVEGFKVEFDNKSEMEKFNNIIGINKLKRWLYEKTDTCNKIVQLGWNKNGFWAWSNRIFIPDLNKLMLNPKFKNR